MDFSKTVYLTCTTYHHFSISVNIQTRALLCDAYICNMHKYCMLYYLYSGAGADPSAGLLV